MSSVGPSSASDRNGQDDKIRRTRENYQQKEGETVKKHSQEIRRLTEAHQTEIEKLKKAHDEELAELKEKSQEVLNRHDVKYQREMDELREMYQKQMMLKAQDTEGRSDRRTEALRNEIEQVTAQSERQQKAVKQEYEQALQQKDKQMEELSDLYRNEIQKQTTDVKRKLNDNHKEEIYSLVKDRDSRLTQGQEHYNQLKRSKDLEQRDLAHTYESRIDKLGQNFKINLEDERLDHKAAQDMERKGFDHAIAQNKENYNRALDKEKQGLEAAREYLYETANGRVDTRVRVAEADLAKFKKDKVRDDLRAKQSKNIELQNAKDSFQANVDSLQREKDEMLGAFNKKTATEISRLNEKNEKLVSSTNQFYQEKIAMDTVRADERVNRLSMDNQKEKQHQESVNDARFNRLKGFDEIEREKMRAYFDNASKAMKENFENTLNELRVQHKEDTNRLFDNFEKRAQANDAKFQEQLGSQTVKYERQITELKEMHRKEMKDYMAQSERRLKETEKKANTDIQSQVSQYNYRLAKQEDSHKRDMQDLQRKHQEALENLTKNREG